MPEKAGIWIKKTGFFQKNPVFRKLRIMSCRRKPVFGLKKPDFFEKSGFSQI